MVNIKIDDKEVLVEDNITVLDVAKKLSINIPHLCYLKGINNNASCRMCLVEVKGSPKLVTACSTFVKEGMEVFTNTEKILDARKENLELLLSNHNRECLNCLKNTKCNLQHLFDEYHITDGKYGKIGRLKEKDTSTSYIVRDSNKCILCGRCVEVCKNIQSIEVIGKNKRGIKTNIGCAFDNNLVDSPCIGCGQCVLVCPTGALMEKDDTKAVKEALSKDLKVIACIAPSICVSLGEEFNFPIGTNVKGKMIASLRKLGFDKVFDVSFGADLTVMEEAKELVDRIKENKNLPLFTSCSPGWVRYVEYYHPDMIKNLSTCKSPQQMLGSVIKTYYAKKNNIDPSKLFVVMIMPCIAKKFEKTKDNEVDAVLTTRELARLIKEKNINFSNLTDEEYDNPFGIGASIIFGSTGGVMEAALRTLVELSTKKLLEKIEFNEVRGLKGVKEACYNVNGRKISVAAVSGIKNAKEILKKIKNKEVNYDFVEFMACPGGCINGGGQPYIDFSKYNSEEVINLRMQGLLNEDGNKVIRKAHENPNIHELYDNYLDYPGSNKAEELLHTKYQERKKYKEEK